MTCWRRLAEWTEAEAWPRLHEVLLAKLRRANAMDFSQAAVDGSHVRAQKRGSKTGRSPVDRGRTDSKRHLITDATGIPLAATLTGGNRNDVTATGGGTAGAGQARPAQEPPGCGAG